MFRLDGNEFMCGRLELAEAKPMLRQDCKLQSAVTKKIDSQTSCCECRAETVICAGVYK